MPNIHGNPKFWSGTILNKRQVDEVKKYDIIASKQETTSNFYQLFNKGQTKINDK